MIISEDEKSRILEMHKNATKKQYLVEQKLQGNVDWANKQSSVVKNLTAQWNSRKIPFTPVIAGPYLLSLNDTNFNNKPEIFKKNEDYTGSVTGWRLIWGGFPCIQNIGNGGYYTFGSTGFKNFNVNTDVIVPNTIETLNNNLNQVSLSTLQTMWKNIEQDTNFVKFFDIVKKRVLEYQNNPTDEADGKGFDKITGNAADFLKSLKFA